MSAPASLRRDALDAVERYVDVEPTAQGVLERTVEALRSRFGHYSWVGVYRVEGGALELAAWSGPEATEHVSIPIGSGICGAAAASGRTEIVDDVSADARYLACFPSTRSEIVVPIFSLAEDGQVVGEIDVDSDAPASFDEEDREFLEHVARMLSSRWNG